MSDEKPLHVRVAEALGWTEIVEAPFMPVTISNWLGKPPAWDRDPHQYVAHVNRDTRALTIGAGSIPRYDTDWSATGPLIERYGITLACSDPGDWVAAIDFMGIYGDDWVDCGWHEATDAESPLLAICQLILALKAAGRLE